MLVSSSAPNLITNEVLFNDNKCLSEPYLMATDSCVNFSEDEEFTDIGEDDDVGNSSSSREWTSGDYDEVCSDDAEGFDVVPVCSDMKITDLEPEVAKPTTPPPSKTKSGNKDQKQKPEEDDDDDDEEESGSESEAEETD